MSDARLKFDVVSRCPDTKARAGILKTAHSIIETPVFMPVGTHAVVRSQRFDEIEGLGARMLLANTYHLLLRPGPEVFERFGGYHGLTKWPHSVLTDSGGFQIFCLASDREMTESGAIFRSYVDNKKILLTPEKSIDTQLAINSDIMMVLDYCVPSTSTRELSQYAIDVTARWAKRSYERRGEHSNALFGIIQGACFEGLRRESAARITEIPFEGFAIGGLAVGETIAERQDMTELTASLLPHDKPRYLMGVGTPVDLLDAIYRGVDMFDCILPTAMAQQGVVFTSVGKKDLRRGAYRFSDDAIDVNCSCVTCKTYPIAYLHHLLKVKDLMAWQLCGVHNIHFYLELMRSARAAIVAGDYQDFYHARRSVLGQNCLPLKKNPLNSTMSHGLIHA